MANQKPRKHHYVPEGYLSNFSCDEAGNCYTLKVKSKYSPEPIKIMNKSAICYKIDMYRIHSNDLKNRLGVEDDYYIEKELFDYENKQFKFLIEKIDKEQLLNFNEAQNLVKILLNIKQRNISMKINMFTGELLSKLIDKQLIRIKDYFMMRAISEGVEKEKVLNFIAYLKTELNLHMQMEDVKSDMFNESLIDWTNQKHAHIKQIENYLLRSKFTIFKTMQKNFITSDNPGYNMHNNGQFHNTNINGSFAFVFVLSPKSTLVISPRVQDNFMPIIKPMKYVEVDGDIARQMNIATAINCNERIFSRNKDVIEEIKTEILELLED